MTKDVDSVMVSVFGSKLTFPVNSEEERVRIVEASDVLNEFVKNTEASGHSGKSVFCVASLSSLLYYLSQAESFKNENSELRKELDEIREINEIQKSKMETLILSIHCAKHNNFSPVNA